LVAIRVEARVVFRGIEARREMAVGSFELRARGLAVQGAVPLGLRRAVGEVVVRHVELIVVHDAQGQSSIGLVDAEVVAGSADRYAGVGVETAAAAFASGLWCSGWLYRRGRGGVDSLRKARWNKVERHKGRWAVAWRWRQKIWLLAQGAVGERSCGVARAGTCTRPMGEGGVVVV
jgi:hypothetical protein